MSDNKNLNKDFLTKYPTDFNRRAIEKDFNELLNVSLTRTRYNQSYKMCGLDCDFVSLEGRYSKPVCTIPADYVHLYAFGVYLNHSNPYKTRKDADVIKKVAIENDLNLNVKTNDYKQYTYLNAYMNHLRKIIDQMPFYAKNAVVSSPEHKYQRIIHQVMPSIIEKLSLIMYLFLAIPKENCEYPDMNSLHYLNSVLSDVINGYIAKTNPKGKIDFSKMNYWDFNREYLKENMYSNYSCRFPPNYAGNSQLEDICKQVNSYLDDTSNKLNIDCKQLRNAYLEYLADNETDLDKEKKRQNVEFDTECLAYAAQTACDKNGYIMDVTVNPGNMHDSVAFDGLYKRLAERFPKIHAVVADAGYKTPWICKQVIDDGRVPVLPYSRPMGKDGFFRPYDYVYDIYYDCVICPENKVLNYATTNRDGYKEFKSKGYVCENCPSITKCTENAKFEKTVTKHIWMDYLEQAEDIRHTPKYKQLYEKRKETIERVFADAKEKYGMRYTNYRGLAQVTNWVRLSLLP